MEICPIESLIDHSRNGFERESSFEKFKTWIPEKIFRVDWLMISPRC